MKDLLAQESSGIKLYGEGGYLQGFGPLGLEGSKGPADAGTLFTTFLSSIIGLMTVIAFIWFIFLLLMGGYGIMTSGGDQAAMETARKRLTSGVVGLVVVIAAIFIFRLVAMLFGLESILDINEAIKNIRIK